jgi:hypothetical protein
VGVQISPSAPILACSDREKAVKFIQSGSSSAVERFLAKEEVAGSNPVFRSSKFASSGGVAKRLRQGSAKPPCGGSNPPAAFSSHQLSGRGGGMVDAADLKSASCKGVWVRVPPSAVNQRLDYPERYPHLSIEDITFLSLTSATLRIILF